MLVSCKMGDTAAAEIKNCCEKPLVRKFLQLHIKFPCAYLLKYLCNYESL